MTNSEAINWIINISADIGKAEHCDLWHYEQALSEIRDMLESAQPDTTTDDSNVVKKGGNDEDRTSGECISTQPERKTVFNRDIAIEAICDEVMLWFDISATQAYEIAETAVKRIEVRMEKTNRGEKE